jgi:acetyl esterase/lipase
VGSRELVDIELLAHLDRFPAPADTVAGFRRIAEGLAPGPLQSDPSVGLRQLHIPGPNGAPDVRVHVYCPRNAGAPLGAYLHIHGGGYIVGSPWLGYP